MVTRALVEDDLPGGIVRIRSVRILVSQEFLIAMHPDITGLWLQVGWPDVLVLLHA